MLIRELKVQGFRSLADVTLTLEPYTTLIGENNTGKSALLRALCCLFDPALEIDPKDHCSFAGDGADYAVTATIEGCSAAHGLAVDGRLTARLSFGPSGKALDYRGQTPQSVTLRSMLAGQLTRNEYAADKALPAVARDVIDSVLNELAPTGRVPGPVWTAAYQRLLDSGLVEFVEGWCPIEPSQLADIIQVVFLSADHRASDEVSGATNTVLDRVGGYILREATRRDSAFVDALAALQDAIDRVTAKGADGRWSLEEVNRLQAVLEEELRRFDPVIDVQTVLHPPKLPKLAFGITVDVGDGHSVGLTRQGHGLQRSLVFAMLRTLSRLPELTSEPESGTGGASPGPHYLFVIEEPELYLHPQAELRRMKELQDLAAQPHAQVVLCTHSAFFVDIAQYKGIVKLERLNRGPTTARNWRGPDLNADQEKLLKDIKRFQPGNAAMLFAKRVILVEGQAEQVSVPAIAERMGFDTFDAVVVDCGGNQNIPEFQRLIEGFGCEYVAWPDSDCGDVVDRVATEMGPLGRLVVTDGNWETMAEVDCGRRLKVYASWEKFVRNSEEANDKTKARVRAAYEFEDYPPRPDGLPR